MRSRGDCTQGCSLSDWATVETGGLLNCWVLMLIRWPEVVESFWVAKWIELVFGEEEVVANR